MPKPTTFQTRARTIDHLGRGQIADAPTAVSELWKNAYDAYADEVSLHIFDAPDAEPNSVPVAAVFDDGIGMDETDFLERWLVIGTDSKLAESADPPKPPPGKEPRIRQGEKGIGRLSAAFLAPMTLVVSRKAGCPWLAALVDWRLFENPFLAIEDIAVAVETFDSPEELLNRLPAMQATVWSNLAEGPNGPERQKRAWTRFDQLEQGKGITPATSSRIAASAGKNLLSLRHLEEWPVFRGDKPTGTALFILDIYRELLLWVDPSVDSANPEVEHVKERLKQTLIHFTDPYVSKRTKFGYQAIQHLGNKRNVILNWENDFILQDFLNLEHFVDGEFDEYGTFRGILRAFGTERGHVILPCRKSMSSGNRANIGGFKFCIGTWEQERVKTTHDSVSCAFFDQKAAIYGGVAMFRDGLRIMPYGRPDSDPFEIEERRSRHAGREFWSHRRSFGRIAFSSLINPKLKDKAGREGLVDNQAFREMKMLVIALLQELARRFFGGDSALRDEELPKIKARNRAALLAAKKAKKARVGDYRSFLKQNIKPLALDRQQAEELHRRLRAAELNEDFSILEEVGDSYQELRERNLGFQPSIKPTRLTDRDEESFREYRDLLKRHGSTLHEIGRDLNRLAAKWSADPPEVVIRRKFASNQSTLSRQLDHYRKTIKEQLKSLSEIWSQQIEEDFGAYHNQASPVVDASSSSTFGNRLEELDHAYDELSETFAERYEPFLRSLDRLRDNIDLEGALSVTEDERALLETKSEQFTALAQLGITVEFLGHELESMDAEVRRNLLRLPDEVKQSTDFKLAIAAHRSLSDRLHFLAPMSLAGYAPKETIRGTDIADYIRAFFGENLRHRSIRFETTSSFEATRVYERRSRIYPVFLNLVNNAIYWVQQTDRQERKILLDRIDGRIFVSDNGPGVDSDDVPHLFEIFFSRRTNGRGVGLHLCRLNLVSGGHKIRYADPEDPHPLEGANFIIEFKEDRNGSNGR